MGKRTIRVLFLVSEAAKAPEVNIFNGDQCQGGRGTRTKCNQLDIIHPDPTGHTFAPFWSFDEKLKNILNIHDWFSMAKVAFEGFHADWHIALA